MSNSNIFLILNLGCEMLYVIDQRLQAQSVGLEKSTQGIIFSYEVVYVYNFIEIKFYS